MAQITQRGPKAWLVRIRLRGHPQVSQTFASEAAAKAFARTTEKAMRQGKHTDTEKGPTVAEAVEAFRELRAAGGRDIDPRANEEYMLRHLADPDGIGRVPVRALKPARLVSWARSRAEVGAGPYTVGMELSKLSTVLKYAAISLHETWGDPVAAARPALEYSGLVGAGTHRTRRPTKDELARVLDHLDPAMQDIVFFAIATTMRRAEITRILWADVDRERRLVLIRDRKHPRKTKGNNVWVPLIALTGYDAWAILDRQPVLSDRVFPVENEWLSDTFFAACQSAKVEDLHFHDLRHEGISRLFEAGLTIERVALVSGHADWRSLRRYTQLKPEMLTARPAADPPAAAQAPG